MSINMDNTDIRLRQLTDRYMQYQEKTVKASTYKRNYHAYNTLCRILGNDTIVNRLTSQYIREQLLATNKFYSF